MTDEPKDTDDKVGITVYIDSDLLAYAKARNMDLAKMLEEAVEERLGLTSTVQ